MKQMRLWCPILIAVCIVVCATATLAAVLRVSSLVADAGKYLGRQIQVEGTVARLLEAGDAEKPASYLLRDQFGDQITVKKNGAAPAPGARLSVTGLFAMAPGGGEYFIQAITTAPLNDPSASSAGTGTGAATPPPVPLFGGPGLKKKLAMAAALTSALLLLIIAVAIKIKSNKKKVLEIPEYNFDHINTVYVDSNGKFNKTSDDEELTRLILPGYYEITRGPQELQGSKFYLASLVTKIGREESGRDKSQGWITLPASLSTVSRNQAEIVYRDGGYYIENKSKTNSTMVNGVPLPPDQPVLLNDCDRISFGGIELTYVRPS